MATYFRFRRSDGAFVGYDYAPLNEAEAADFILAEASAAQIAAHRAGTNPVWPAEGLVEAPAVPLPPPPEPAPPPPAAPREIPSLAFRRRFTPAELAAITLAAQQSLAAGDATWRVWIDDLNAAGTVDLDDAELPVGLAALVSAGLLAADRPAQILA